MPPWIRALLKTVDHNPIVNGGDTVWACIRVLDELGDSRCEKSRLSEHCVAFHPARFCRLHRVLWLADVQRPQVIGSERVHDIPCVRWREMCRSTTSSWTCDPGLKTYKSEFRIRRIRCLLSSNSWVELSDHDEWREPTKSLIKDAWPVTSSFSLISDSLCHDFACQFGGIQHKALSIRWRAHRTYNHHSITDVHRNSHGSHKIKRNDPSLDSPHQRLTHFSKQQQRLLSSWLSGNMHRITSDFASSHKLSSYKRVSSRWLPTWRHCCAQLLKSTYGYPYFDKCLIDMNSLNRILDDIGMFWRKFVNFQDMPSVWVSSIQIVNSPSEKNIQFALRTSTTDLLML
jgi:hypothetical protein